MASPLDLANATPYGAAFSAGASVLGSAFASPPSSSSAQGGSSKSGFDNSGFAVSFGSGSATAGKGGGVQLTPWLIGGGIAAATLVALVAVKAWTKKKG